MNRRPSEMACEKLLTSHVQKLLKCTLCTNMHKPVVSGGANVSKVLLLGQAPGDKEPILRRPWAWTAGKTLFRWFEESVGWNEAEVRKNIYIAAVCRCFPGKKESGGDRVPAKDEIQNCSKWLDTELTILEPDLVIAVGRLAIEQFMPARKLEELIGRQFKARYGKLQFDFIPLPHPSGASPWHRVEPGKTLTQKALALIATHPAIREINKERRVVSTPEV